MRPECTSLIVLSMIVNSSFCCADVLWDQQPNTDLVAAKDQDYPDFPDFNVYMVSDATFNIDVVVSSVTTYYTNGNNGSWLGVTEAVFNIFDGNTLGDADDPRFGGDFGPGTIPVSVAEIGNNIIAVTADLGLGPGIGLSAGTYWFGLTPKAAFNTLGSEFRHDSGEDIGAGTFYRNPLGGFGLPAGTGWGTADPDLVPGYGDAAITIKGTAIPEPSTTGLVTLGLFGLNALTRRRQPAQK